MELKFCVKCCRAVALSRMLGTMVVWPKSVMIVESKDLARLSEASHMLGVALLEARSDTGWVCLLSLDGVRTLNPLPSQVSLSAATSVFASQR